MGMFHKIMLRLLGSQGDKIHSEFGEVVIRTTKELEKCDVSVRDLLLDWLVSFPWAYFESVFIHDHGWNTSLRDVFDNAEVINGEECASVSQAFCLYFLEELTRNDDNYKAYSLFDIEQVIRNHITKGTEITRQLEKFRQFLKYKPPFEPYGYISEILNVLCSDPEKKSSVIRALELDSQLGLSLSIHFIEMIKGIKDIDRNEKLGLLK